MRTNQEKTPMNIDEKRIYIFYGITFGLAYLIFFILYFNGGLISATEIFPGYRMATVLTMVYLALPAVGNILTRVITKEGWKRINLRPNLRKGWKFWVLAWLGVPVLIAFGAAVFFLLFPDFFDPDLTYIATNLENYGYSVDMLTVSLGTLLLWEVLQKAALSPIFNLPTAFASEFGWRGYLQPKLMQMGPRKAILITGLSWGFFLAPLVSMGYTYGYYDINYYGAPISGIIMITLACTYLGVVFGWLSYRGGSVWPAVIGYSMLTGVADVALLVSQGVQPLLLGPTINGILGGSGFVIAAILILTSNKAMDTLPKQRTSWKTPKDEQEATAHKKKKKVRIR